MFSGSCNPDQVEGCDGRTIRELCRDCGKNPAARKTVSPYLASLVRVHLLQEAGFRFENDSFSLGFWFDLAVLKQRMRGPGR